MPKIRRSAGFLATAKRLCLTEVGLEPTQDDLRTADGRCYYEGDQAMAGSDMENDPKYKFGVLDTKVDRLQEDMTNLTSVVTQGFAEVKNMFSNHIASEKRKEENEQTARRDSLWNLRNGLIVAVAGSIGAILAKIS